MSAATYWAVVRRRGRPRVPALALFGVIIAGAIGSVEAGGHEDAATVMSPADRIEPPSSVLLVSDSAWLGIRLYGAADAMRGVTNVLDLASCRRRVVRSCTNYDGFVPITLLDEIRVHGRGPTSLVVATGYNDSDAGFADEVDLIIRTARQHGYRRVVWLTLRTGVSYRSPGSAGFDAVFVRNNATLRTIAADATYPELVVADWAGYAKDHPEWFARDGIHLRRAGPFVAADYISRKLAFLDRRACPVPAAPATPIADPCPDPDAAPPPPDMELLYPVGQPIPATPFTLEWEGSSAWPGPAWWET